MTTDITTLTRPKSLNEVIGNERNLRLIKIAVEGAKLRGTTIPSFIIDGPGGTGKSTLAHCIADYAGGELHKIWGSDLKKPEDIYDLALKPKDGDVLFIEEAHTMGGLRSGKLCQAMFYEWIEDKTLTGGAAFGVALPPKISIIFATTDSGRLTKPLQTRCQHISTCYYSVENIEKILVNAGQKLEPPIDLSTDTAALRLLAQSSRGTPRTAVLQRLDMLLNFLSIENLRFSLETVKQFLEALGIHEWGFEEADLRYLNSLYDQININGGSPVGLNTLSQITGLETNVLTHKIEPYCLQIGVLAITGSGRMLTNKGFETLRKQQVQIRAVAQNTGINIQTVKDYLENNAHENKGVQPLMKLLNLQYTRNVDRERVMGALAQLGYESKQRVGIRKKI